MADFMTVLAANQGKHGGKAAASASGDMPAGFFAELLSAQFKTPAELLPTLQAPQLAQLTGAPLKLTADVALTAEEEPSQGESSEVAVDPGAAGLLASLFNPAAELSSMELTPMQKAASPAASVAGEGQALPRLAALSADKAVQASELASGGQLQAETLALALPDATGKEAELTEMLAASDQAPASAALPPASNAKLAPDDLSLLGVQRQSPLDMRGVDAMQRLGVEAPVHSRAFRTEFAEKVVWLAGQQTQSAELSLNPQHLGALEVRLSLSGGEAGAQFYSPHPAVRDAIEAALPKLREMLAQAGISLGDTQVRDEAFQQREDRPTFQGATPGQDGESLTAGVVPSAGVVRSGLGLVDLYA